VRPIAVVEEHRATESWNVVIAGWCFCVFLAKKSAEHCARDINQDHADGIKEAVAEAVKKDRTCRECGGTDSVCLKGHEDSMKEVRERERKAVEDFREKCLDIVLGDCYGLVTDEREAAHNADIVAIAEKIRDLPTEPEAK
jgi:hypothetical protein